MRYSIEPKGRIYVKGYGLLSFAKKHGSQLSSKYGHKRLDNVKKSTKDAIKTASKAAEATGDLICNKIADKITSVSNKKALPNNNNNNNNTEDIEITTHKRKIYISRRKIANY